LYEGIVVRGQGGFYYVKTEIGILECRGRGKLKKDLNEILVGDRVVCSALPDDEGVIDRVLPRHTRLVRPSIANVDQVVTVFAVKNPDPIPLLIDKFLAVISSAGLKPIIVFNKIDLLGTEAFSLADVYRNAGYPVYLTSTKKQQGIDELRDILIDKVTVFSGPSGVGKSALLNHIQKDLILQTGDVSQKIKRGKHTTRHASLMLLDEGGWVADTPGFSVLDLSEIAKDELQGLFPEFQPYINSCRFNGCFHRAEPDCAVKAAVANGLINQGRYDNYISLLCEIESLPPEWARKSDGRSG
jgi:ribosome biogenesis GTPase